ncbi:MAG: PQQ-binding-like beta-propeller repeat protein [Rhodospirillales bacterium]
MRRFLALACLCVLLSGCADWFEGPQAPPLPGERIPVLTLDRKIDPDPRMADVKVALPRPEVNPEWPQPGGLPSHAMQHPEATGRLERVWDVGVGRGGSSDSQLLAQPVIADGRVYTLDVRAEARAFDAATGREIWRRGLAPREDDEGILGGGIAFSRGRLVASTGFGAVVALDAATGEEVWRRSVSGPMRAGPTIYGDRVFVVTIANQVHALSMDDGRVLWSSAGIGETAGLLGGAAPAADADVVIAPFSSGEMTALRMENGRTIWTESLTAVRATDPVSALSHIRGHPVIDRGRVIAVSHSGRMVAVDLRTGNRIWEQAIGGTYMPWVAGDYIFVVSNNGELACVSRLDGRVRWVQPMQRYENEERKRDPITWAGPVLVGDRLIVAGSNGEVWSYSPYTGEALGRIRLSGPIYLQPAVANETVYILTDRAQLIALR